MMTFQEPLDKSSTHHENRMNRSLVDISSVQNLTNAYCLFDYHEMNTAKIEQAMHRRLSSSNATLFQLFDKGDVDRFQRIRHNPFMMAATDSVVVEFDQDETTHIVQILLDDIIEARDTLGCFPPKTLKLVSVCKGVCGCACAHLKVDGNGWTTIKRAMIYDNI